MVCKTKKPRFSLCLSKKMKHRFIWSHLNYLWLSQSPLKELSDLFTKTMKQACNAETTEHQQAAHINWSTQTFLAVGEKA